MSTPDSFLLHAIRCLPLGERRVTAGARFHAPAALAIELIRDGKARLVTDADLPILIGAYRALSAAPTR
jgi:hypothetical protein